MSNRRPFAGWDIPEWALSPDPQAARPTRPVGPTKRCARCKQEEPAGEKGAFGKNRSRPDGYEHYCKECKRAYDRGRKARRPPTPPRMDGYKRCTACLKRKRRTSFGPVSAHLDGRAIYCLTCQRRRSRDSNKSLKGKARKKKWEAANRPKVRARQRAWRKKGSPAVARNDAYSKQWRLDHREQYLASLRQWAINHPQADRDKQHQRRAAKFGLGSEKVDFDAVVERDGGICRLCGGPVDLHLSRRHPMGPTEEHLIPRRYFTDQGMPGLWHTMANVALAHRLCNGIKHDRPLTPDLEAEIRVRMGLLLLRAEVLRRLYGR